MASSMKKQFGCTLESLAMLPALRKRLESRMLKRMTLTRARTALNGEVVQDHHDTHAKLVVVFAAQGYDVLCEKPMAMSIEHCLQIEAAVKKAGIIFGMGHGLHFTHGEIVGGHEHFHRDGLPHWSNNRPPATFRRRW
jgi:hypothetical protein